MSRPVTAAETLRAARAALGEGRADEVFRHADALADDPAAEVQAPLAALLREAGEADPEALSVFLAANAFRLPRATIAEAARALPEAG